MRQVKAAGQPRTAEAAEPAANLTTSSPCLDSFTAETITDLYTYCVSANSDPSERYNYVMEVIIW